MTFDDKKVELAPGSTGATRQSWEEHNPREVLRGVMKQSPGASEKEVHDAVKEAVFEDWRYLEAIYEYWFTNNYRAFEVHSSDHTVSVMARKRARGLRAKMRKHLGKRHVAFVHGILMDMELSSGKLLRDATFADCKRESGWLLEVAKSGKPNEVVGRHLTEQQLDSLWRRHYIGIKKTG